MGAMPSKRVTRADFVELVPSSFPGRPYTINFDRPPGMSSRWVDLPNAEVGHASVSASARELLVRVDLKTSGLDVRMLHIHTTKDLPLALRHAFKRAGFTVTSADQESSDGPDTTPPLARPAPVASAQAPGASAPEPRASAPAPAVCWEQHHGDIWTTLRAGSVINHFPGSRVLGDKGELARILHEQHVRLRSPTAPSEYGFAPQSFVLPRDRRRLKQAILKGDLQGAGVFIIKPLRMSKGTGIFITTTPLDDFDQQLAQDPASSLLVQEYISNPLLLQERKFDLRIYVLVTSFEPLRAYAFEHGLGRFASRKYEVPIEGALGERNAHLTNYSLNKVSCPTRGVDPRAPTDRSGRAAGRS